MPRFPFPPRAANAARLFTLIALISALSFTAMTIQAGAPVAAQSRFSAGPTVARHRQDEPEPALPKRLQIPALHIDAPIVPVAFDDDGSMASPNGPDAVAWFEPGFLPGTPGNAVMAGHVDWVDRAAVFWFLKKLSPGDTVTVVFADGSTATFAVDDIEVYGEEDTPMDQIFGNSDAPHLNLVTCGGVYNRATHNYDQRTVVYTTLMQDPPGDASRIQGPDPLANARGRDMLRP